MGGRKETVSDEEILQLFVDADRPFLTSPEVAEKLDFTRAGAIKRLNSLETGGYLNVKKTGNTNIWWITDAGKDSIDEDS